MSSITVSAVPIHQSGKSSYLCQFTMSELADLFKDNDPKLPIEERHQRPRSERRSGEIADYILENYTKKSPFILPPIVASMDSEKFVYNAGDGELTIDLESSRLLINDGQHRHRGIQIALNENGAIADQQVGVWIIPDVKLSHAQQIFSDINKNAKPSSKSLNLIFDHRNVDVALSKDIKNKVLLFQKFTETEKGQATKGKLFVFVALHKANCLLNEALVDKGIVGSAQVPYIVAFWSVLSSIIPEWKFVADFVEEADGSDIAMQNLYSQMEETKKATIAFHNGLIGCFGKIGAEIFAHLDKGSQTYFDYLEENLSPLAEFDFSKNNPVLTENGIVVLGAKDKLRAVNSTASRQVLLELLKQEIGLAPKQLELIK